MAAPSPFHVAISSFVSFFLFLTLFVLIFSLNTFFKKIDENPQEKSIKIPSLPVDNTDNYDRNRTQQQKQENPHESNPCINGDPNNINGSDQEEKKMKKKRVKKKRHDINYGEKKEKEEFVCLYPFTKSSSAIQRKIKLHYDQLVKSHESKGLTLAQMGKFINCLIEARNELQNKSKVIKRKFLITKALFFKADKSSVNRLHEQRFLHGLRARRGVQRLLLASSVQTHNSTKSLCFLFEFLSSSSHLVIPFRHSLSSTTQLQFTSLYPGKQALAILR